MLETNVFIWNIIKICHTITVHVLDSCLSEWYKFIPMFTTKEYLIIYADYGGCRFIYICLILAVDLAEKNEKAIWCKCYYV